MEKQYIVLAAKDLETLEEKGADVEETHCQTGVEARRRARYLLTEEYRIASESSERLGYSRVVVTRPGSSAINGICVADFFAKR